MYLKENNISHYLFSYDLLEYNFKDIYQSFNISYFTKNNNLLDNFVNIDELRDYEEIQNDNEVLIKKFKLRISVESNDLFSNDIIISEDYMFDFINLNHADHLIKIAIVQDHINEWIESGKLKGYDYIFTINKEYRKLLKKNHKKVFIVKGDSTYLQLKNILNLLYMRRQEKFYQFIYNRFQHVFPRWKDYFKIYHSEFFDEEWYRRVYGIPNNTDPVFHYLVLGYKKNFNPGPNFNTKEYYMINQDVKRAGINPLIHYEKFGKLENRKYQLSKEEKENILSYISDSPYFDAEWYEKTYDISQDNLEPAAHYLTIGYQRGYDPGPNFSTKGYYALHPDVMVSGKNPLLHYEQYGRNENRTLPSSD